VNSAGSATWSLIVGDCLDILPDIPAASISHTLADPPYESAAHTKQRRLRGVTTDDGNRVLNVEPLSFDPISNEDRVAISCEIARVTQRWALVFCQVEAAMAWRDAIRGDEGDINGFGYRRTCVWIKPDGMPQLTGDRPGMGYESIVAMHRTGRSRWNGGGRLGVFVHTKSDPLGKGKNEHPTQKPLPLMLELVDLFTDPGDIVLDPFAGSGTTGVACIRLGRRFVGIEKDPKYASLARERLAAEVAQSTLIDRRRGQCSLFGTSE